MLSTESIDARYRNRLVNIHITIIHWLTEFTAFLVVTLGSFVFGHKNAILTLCLQTTSNFILFNLLPCVFLMNNPDVKSRIAESHLYIRILKTFNIERNLKENEEEGTEAREESQSNADSNHDARLPAPEE